MEVVDRYHTRVGMLASGRQRPLGTLPPQCPLSEVKQTFTASNRYAQNRGKILSRATPCKLIVHRWS